MPTRVPRRIASILCVFLALNLIAQDPIHRRYSVNDGLPSNTVYCAIEAHDGYMWFGTDAGAVRFDGIEFTYFGPAEGVTDNEVIGIHEDSAQRLWFLTLNGSLCYWKDGHVIRIVDDPGAASSWRSGWMSFCEDQEGRLWFSGVRGELLRLDMDGDSDLYFPADGRVRSVFKDREGRIMCSRTGGFVERFDGVRFVPFAILPTVPEICNAVHQPVGLDQAPVVLGAHEAYELGARGPLELLGTRGKIDPLLHRDCVRDTKGDLWIHRRDQGVDHLKRTDQGFGPITRRFANYNINSLFEDERGGWWFCTPDQGVFHVQGGADQGLIHEYGDKASEDGLTAIASSRGRVWIGSEKGAVLSFQNGSMQEDFPAGSNGVTGRILRIRPDVRGNLWFGGDYGLFQWSLDRPSLLKRIAGGSENDGMVSNPAMAAKTVLITSKGETYSAGNGLFKVVDRDDAMFRVYVLPDPLAARRINCLVEDDEGTIWMDGPGRIVSMTSDSLEDFPLSPGFGQLRITDMLAWATDTLVLATAGKGILFWTRSGVVGSIGQRQGLVSNMVRRLYRTGDTLWCASAKGVTSLVMKGAVVIDHWKWTAQEGLPSEDVKDLVTFQGRLLLATSEGLCDLAIRPILSDRVLPRPHFAHVSINGAEQAFLPKMLQLRIDDRCTIIARTLEFDHAEQVEYAYSLDGDGEWMSVKDGRIVLDRLAEGSHAVVIRCRSPDGPWSAPLAASLVVSPFWWASREVKSGSIVLVLVFAFLGFYYWSRRSFRRKTAQVRAQMALDEERRRIAADVHDDLGADLSRLLLLARQDGKPSGASTVVTEGITSALEKIDEIIWSLDPKRDTVQSTAHFIEQQAREITSGHGLKFRISMDLPELDTVLHADHRRNLMLIAREAVRNVVKHAGATRLSMHWSLVAGHIKVRIEDDGTGIRIGSGKEGRNGMFNMRERAKRLGGELLITEISPHGTRIEVDLPLEQIIRSGDTREGKK